MTAKALAPYGIHWENFPEELILHRLLAQGELRKEKLSPLISRNKGLQAKDPRYGLTPLQLAAMTNNIACTILLLEKEVSELQQDVRGWTARHHAIAQEHGDILDLLSEHDIETNRGWTPDEMQRRLRPIQSEKPFFFKGSQDKEPKLCPPEQFKDLTGTIYVDKVFVTRELLLREWQQPHEIDDTLSIISETLQNIQLDDNRVYLAPSKAGVGFGTFARTQIAANTALVCYNGRATSKKDGSYILGDVDAKDFGSLASRINHSFPNAIFHPIQDGEIEVPVIITTDEILQDEEICVHYGDSSKEIVGDDLVELREEAKAAFTEDESTLDTLLKVKNPTFEEAVSILKFASKLDYVSEK